MIVWWFRAYYDDDPTVTCHNCGNPCDDDGYDVVAKTLAEARSDEAQAWCCRCSADLPEATEEDLRRE